MLPRLPRLAQAGPDDDVARLSPAGLRWTNRTVQAIRWAWRGRGDFRQLSEPGQGTLLDWQKAPSIQREVARMIAKVHHQFSLGEDAAAGSTAFNQLAKDAGPSHRRRAVRATSGGQAKEAR